MAVVDVCYTYITLGLQAFLVSTFSVRKSCILHRKK